MRSSSVTAQLRIVHTSVSFLYLPYVFDIFLYLLASSISWWLKLSIHLSISGNVEGTTFRFMLSYIIYAHLKCPSNCSFTGHTRRKFCQPDTTRPVKPKWRHFIIVASRTKFLLFIEYISTLRNGWMLVLHFPLFPTHPHPLAFLDWLAVSQLLCFLNLSVFIVLSLKQRAVSLCHVIKATVTHLCCQCQ